jgi:Tfp pilus assembly protein PilO
VLLGANLVVAAAYTLPRGLKQRGIEERAEALRQEVAQSRQAVAELEGRAQRARENEAAEKRFFAEVVGTRKATLVPTLAELEKLLAEPGIKAGGRSFAADPMKDMPLLRLSMSVSLTGGYRRLVEFLGGLERSKHFVTVDKVEIRERRSEEETAEGALSVGVSAWFRAEEGETLE